MICFSLPLYDLPPNPSFCCVFPNRCTIFLPNILSSALLCLWFLFNLTVFSYHSSIVQEGLSASANFLLIPPLNPPLNSSIRGHLSYLLSLAIFLNSWIYSSYVFPSCFIILNCSTFLSFSIVFPNLFLILLNNSFTVSISNFPFDNPSNRLSF